MKRILSMTLAVAMIFAMASISFAKKADVISENFSNGGITGVYSRNGHAATYYIPKEGDDTYSSTDELPAEFGSCVYIELLHDAGDYTLDMIRNLKVKAEWEEGGDLVDFVDVIILGITRNNTRVYGPVVRIKLKDSTDTTEADVIGTLTLSKKTGDKEYRFKDAEVPVEFTAGYFYNFLTYDELLIDHDQQIIYPGDPHLLKFDCDDEVEFSFGSESNEGTFTVDVSGQGKVLMLFDTMPNSAVEATNPNANMIFFGFNHVQFNRTGEFFYETETGKYIYELVDGMLVEIAGAEYDEADEGFRFYTRTLGNYVISDIPMVAPDPEAAKAAELSGTERYNPVTRTIKRADS